MSPTIPKDLPPGKLYRVERGIYVRKTRAGRLRYFVRVTTSYKDILRVAGDSISMARTERRDLETDIDRGKLELKNKGRAPAFSDFVDTYLEYAKQHKRSWKRDEGALRPLSDFLAPKRLNEVTAWDIERYKARRRQRVEPATVNRDLAVVRHLFNMASKWGYKVDNPMDAVKPFKVDQAAIRVLTDEEERALYAAAAEHLRPVLVVALNTGLRRGELLTLQWEQVDMHEKVITVKHSKSGKVRYVPLNDMVWNYLHAQPGGHDKGPVFTFQGNPVASIKTAFAAAVRRAGIPPLRFHDLRHTFATRMVLAGADLPTVQELMGHASITTTRRYAHPAPSHKRAAVNRLLFAHYRYQSRVRDKSVKREK
ncbi:MAG: tyrosine-type recombinase/integrase [Planctomycetota bacterium]|jgi:integrase